jgi:hypothetical protein
MLPGAQPLGNEVIVLPGETWHFHNGSAWPLPLIVAVFGAPKTIDVALALAAGSIVLSPLTLAILEANKAPTVARTPIRLLIARQDFGSDGRLSY